MATITAATTPTSSMVVAARLVRKVPIGLSSSPLLGMKAAAQRGGRVKCSMEKKEESSSGVMGLGASLVAAACAATMTSAPAAMALVDERMSTEGTGLPFGLSNNLLVWILVGVFALIWANYFVYTSSLEEDEESGLSL